MQSTWFQIYVFNLNTNFNVTQYCVIVILPDINNNADDIMTDDIMTLWQMRTLFSATLWSRAKLFSSFFNSLTTESNLSV